MITEAEVRQIGARVGASYARDGWSDCDNAAASWLRSDNSSCFAVRDHRLLAEMAFVRGFRAKRIEMARR